VVNRGSWWKWLVRNMVHQIEVELSMSNVEEGGRECSWLLLAVGSGGAGVVWC
jgi:hypothetical protein